VGQRLPRVDPTLMGGALLLTGSLALAIPLSINFAHTLNLDPAPLKNPHEFLLTPKPDDGPGTFRTEMLVSSWAEHLRQYARTTKAETELVERVWAMHAGDEEPIVRHYLPANRLWTPLRFSRFQKQPGARFTQVP
jgi:hypothetical protein